MAKKTKAAAVVPDIMNSLGGLVGDIYGSAFANGGVQLSQTDTMFINNRWYLLSNFRQLLAQMYVEHGIVQTLVDQPVDDAFRSGFEIKTGQLSGEEIEDLEVFMEKEGAISALIQAKKWTRLFGGGAVLIITDQDPATPLDMAKLKDNSPIEFRAVDMWELFFTRQNIEGDTNAGSIDWKPEFYDYYGKKVHNSRVLAQKGKAAPSFIRPRLRGWGMSELERLVRSINQYLKNQDVIFELLDEAKIDVYKIDGMNNSLISDKGTRTISNRIQHANSIKNYNNAIVMDTKDDYAQKQMNFAGLSEVLTQIRQGIAADLKMPMTKLFGISSAGFNSGEDDIENYNSMLEGEIRSQCKYQVVELLNIGCQMLFGFIPDDMKIVWNPLRILSAVEEEDVKYKQFNRVMSAFSSGLVTAQEAKQSINKDSLLAVEVDENSDAMPPLNSAPDQKEEPKE